MKYTKLYLAAAGIAVIGLAFPAAAEEPVFESEIVIDLNDPDAEDEIDLSAMFEGDDADIDVEAEYEDDGEYNYDEDYEDSDGESDIDFDDENMDDDSLLIEDEESDGMIWYVYKYTEDGADQIMINDVMIVLPEDWTDKYDMILEDERVTFYNRLSRAGYLLEGLEAGRLFSLCLAKPGEEITDIVPTYELGAGSDGNVFYLEFPSDVQAYVSNEDIAAEYSALYEEIDDVKENSFVISYDFDTEEVEEAFTE